MTATQTKQKKKKTYDGPTVEEKMVERLISVMESGVNPWRKTWKGDNGRHRNFITGENYHGGNPMMLEFQSVFGGYSLPLWAGIGQAKALGFYPKKGSQGCYVIRPQLNQYDKEDENGNKIVNDSGENVKVSWVSYKTACVFNIEALQGVDDESKKKLQEILDSATGIAEENNNQEIDIAHKVLSDWEVKVNFVGDKAFYVPTLDMITIPPLKAFESSESFYATWAHEAIHSTGHESRLDRKLIGMKDATSYAKEELIAEMGAFLLCDRLGIGSEVENHASYLEGWIKILKESKNILFKLVGQSVKAANLIANNV